MPAKTKTTKKKTAKINPHKRMKTTIHIKYTPTDLAMLRQIGPQGADVFNYVSAKRLRELERLGSDLFIITGRQRDYGPSEQLPYFGAVLTAAGRSRLLHHRSD